MAGIKVTPEQLQQLSGSVGRGSGEIAGQLGVIGRSCGPRAARDGQALWARPVFRAVATVTARSPR